jgi:hypothetical protein
VIIYAAARIYGRKVDYLEQEIIGMAKNFENVGVINEESSEKKNTEVKKSRSKKFVIKDSVSIRKLTFEEKPVTESDPDEINKSLDEPCRINLLEKMKDFFTKNRAKTGKTVIPKRLLFTSEYVTPNFGDSLIHDFDDEKEIVGSRKDFTCFSYYINNCGELQNEVNYSLQIRIEEDHTMSHDEMNLDHVFSPNFSRPATPNDRVRSPCDWLSPPRSPIRESLERELDLLVEVNQKEKNHDLSQLNIDEGIEVEDFDKSNIQLPESPSLIKVFNFEPSGMLPKIQSDSIEKRNDLELTTSIREDFEESRIANIFMVPLKKLKHKCAFDLPSSEYGELKRMRKELDKSGEKTLTKQTRIFNPFEMMKEANFESCDRACDDKTDDSEEFLGFTEEEQIAAARFFKNPPSKVITKTCLDEIQNTSQSDTSRKNSNDSGFDESCRAEMSSLISPDQSSSLHRDSIDLEKTHANDEDINMDIDSLRNESNDDNNVKINGGDSCYQSLLSGESSKTELSAFFGDLEERNKLIDEKQELENQVDEETLKEYEERVQDMQQNAINVSFHLKHVYLNIS